MRSLGSPETPQWCFRFLNYRSRRIITIPIATPESNPRTSKSSAMVFSMP
jgi:hypothetical protein